ncbi:hypothetical protein HpNP44_00570 [Helicobacter pylori]
MAEWKTDTEEVRQIVKACRDFKGSLQEERCAQFIKNFDGYAREILLERKKIEHRLLDAIEKLRRAKKREVAFGDSLQSVRKVFLKRSGRLSHLLNWVLKLVIRF